MQNFESQSWYRAAHLKPRLADRAEISRLVYRGVIWFVVRDPVSGRFSRLSEAAYTVVSMMDGERQLGEIWDLACAELGDDAPSQDELLATITQLNLLDMLHTDGLPDAEALANRGQRLRRRSFLAHFLNPLAVRFPLFDPNGFLDETWPLVRPLFTWFGALAYIVLLVSGAFTAARHWDSLTNNLIDRVLAAESLLILILVYPVVKAIHELGHGYSVKRWGGEVREIGIMFLVFLPVPYVDASAASGYQNKWARVLVGGAGIMVELGLAAGAVLVWTELEEGFARAVAFNVMVIGGVSTLLFNGNPLLRFDGYFVLADLIEIPNLGARSNRYIGYLIQRYLFGLKTARSPVRAAGERPWFVFYSISSFAYRIFISFTIISYVVAKFFTVGVLLAVWAVTLMFLVPLGKHIRFVLTSESLRGRRARSILVSLVLVGAVTSLLTFVPVPYRTIAEGVIAPREEATIYTEEPGEVVEVLVETAERVARGDTILRLADPFIESELRRAEASALRSRLRYQQAFVTSAYDTRLWRAQMISSEQEAEIVRERMASMEVTVGEAGALVLPNRQDLVGRYLDKGAIVGFVVDPRKLVVQAVVTQESADLIRRRTLAVEISPAEDPTIRQRAEIRRTVPAVGGLLPSFALSTQGGGLFALDPSSRDVPRSLVPVMQVEIETDQPLKVHSLGSRVYVRFDHGSEALAFRLIRAIRQLFLARFGV